MEKKSLDELIRHRSRGKYNVSKKTNSHGVCIMEDEFPKLKKWLIEYELNSSHNVK